MAWCQFGNWPSPDVYGITGAQWVNTLRMGQISSFQKHNFAFIVYYSFIGWCHNLKEKNNNNYSLNMMPSSVIYLFSMIQNTDSLVLIQLKYL